MTTTETAAPTLPEIAVGTPILSVQEPNMTAIIDEASTTAVIENVKATITEEAVASTTPAADVPTTATEEEAVVVVESVATAVEETAEVSIVTKGYLNLRGLLGIPAKRYAVLGKEEDKIALESLFLVHKKFYKTNEPASSDRNKRILADIATASVTTKGLLILYKSEAFLDHPLAVFNLRDLKSVTSTHTSLQVVLTHSTLNFVAPTASDAAKWAKSISATKDEVLASEHADVTASDAYKGVFEKLSAGSAFGKAKAVIATTTPAAAPVVVAPVETPAAEVAAPVDAVVEAVETKETAPAEAPVAIAEVPVTVKKVEKKASAAVIAEEKKGRFSFTLFRKSPSTRGVEKKVEEKKEESVVPVVEVVEAVAEVAKEKVEAVVEEAKAEAAVVEEVKVETVAEAVVEEAKAEAVVEAVVEEVKAEAVVEAVVEEVKVEAVAEAIVEEVKAEAVAEPVAEATTTDAVAETPVEPAASEAAIEAPVSPPTSPKAEKKKSTNFFTRVFTLKREKSAKGMNEVAAEAVVEPVVEAVTEAVAEGVAETPVVEAVAEAVVDDAPPADEVVAPVEEVVAPVEEVVAVVAPASPSPKRKSTFKFNLFGKKTSSASVEKRRRL
ncbi:hypothetical protein BC829DRAFT_491423 [Chytridium lagenaria]|nr:hypothetical protein BC829DRAFT_491423 [Chytridium lagenaria]